MGINWSNWSNSDNEVEKLKDTISDLTNKIENIDIIKKRISEFAEEDKQLKLQIKKCKKKLREYEDNEDKWYDADMNTPTNGGKSKKHRHYKKRTYKRKKLH